MGTKKAEWGTQMKDYNFITDRVPTKWTYAQTIRFLRVMWGLDEYSQVDIAKILNNLGVKTKNGKTWTGNSVSYVFSGFGKFTRNEDTITRFKAMINVVLTRTAPRTSPAAQHVDETETLVTQPNTTVTPTTATGTSKVFGDVLTRDLKTVSDEDVATALQTLATTPMDESIRRLVMVQAVRGIRY